MADKTDITGFALTGDKAVGDNFLHTEYNYIVKFLLAVKAYRVAYEMNQDLNKASTPEFKNIKITDATVVKTDKFVRVGSTTGELILDSAAQFMAACGIPQIIAAKADVIAGFTDVEFPRTFPNATYVFTGMVYGGTGGQPETAFATAEEADYTTTGCKVYSPLAGELHYTITEILD